MSWKWLPIVKNFKFKGSVYKNTLTGRLDLNKHGAAWSNIPPTADEGGPEKTQLSAETKQQIHCSELGSVSVAVEGWDWTYVLK